MSTTTPLGTPDVTGARAPVGGATASPKPPSLLRRVVQRPMGAGALVVFLGIIIACAAAPLIAPYGPYQSSLLTQLASPSGQHLLGTDELGPTSCRACCTAGARRCWPPPRRPPSRWCSARCSAWSADTAGV